MSIFLLVISWAYAIGVFPRAGPKYRFPGRCRRSQQFRRQVRRLETFSHRCRVWKCRPDRRRRPDEHYRRFVVIDERDDRVQSVVSEQLSFDVPAVQGDCSTPALLGMAGLRHPNCEGAGLDRRRRRQPGGGDDGLVAATGPARAGPLRPTAHPEPPGALRRDRQSMPTTGSAIISPSRSNGPSTTNCCAG